jgi:Ferritin-like domain
MMQPVVEKGSDRRSFLRRSALAAGAMTMGAAVLGRGISTFGEQSADASGSLSAGDVALLRMVAAAELVEADLWQQYAELGGVTDGTQTNYQLALQFLDGDGSQYITSNTLDELSHAQFLNAYLSAHGAPPVNFDQFRTLPSSMATGAQQIGRLTNLTMLTVDTSWYIRYRSTTNPDFGATYPQAIKIVNRPSIPRTNADFEPSNHIQAIADTAAFHFGTIEQGGSSLYATLAQKASSLEVLRVLVSIGGDEVAHFLEWVDFAGNAVSGPPYSFTGSQTPVADNGLTFFNFNDLDNPLFQTNLIFPVPCEFISPNLPKCAVVRPTSDSVGGAMAAAKGFINSGLFIGQPQAFIREFLAIAQAADAAVRECD